jgi:hypothetical protein
MTDVEHTDDKQQAKRSNKVQGTNQDKKKLAARRYPRLKGQQWASPLLEITWLPERAIVGAE